MTSMEPAVRSAPTHQAADPFSADRDELEGAAAVIFREFTLRSEVGAIFRQDDDPAGYALILPEERGERVLTVPAAREADFMHHGNPGTSGEELATFIADVARRTRADLIKLPLLSDAQARFLALELSKELPMWHWGYGLTAVRPGVDKTGTGWRRRNSLWRAYERAAQADDLTFDEPRSVPVDEALDLHTRRWGPNRSWAFFEMLSELAQNGAASILTVRDPAGELIGLGCDVMGERTRHLYYGVSDHERYPGMGSVTMGWSWQGFMEHPTQTVFSFGRGSERYKYQYANHVDELFELRGFYSALQRGGDRPAPSV